MRNSEIRRQHKEKSSTVKKIFLFLFIIVFIAGAGAAAGLSVGEQRASGYFRKYCTGCVIPHL